MLGRGISVTSTWPTAVPRSASCPAPTGTRATGPTPPASDYDAPLDEAGRPTPKFEAYRAVIAKHLPARERLPPMPAALPAIRADFPVSSSVRPPRWGSAGSRHRSVQSRPLTQEAIGQDFGFTLYRTRSRSKRGRCARDRRGPRLRGGALGHPRCWGTLDRRLKQTSLDVRLGAGRGPRRARREHGPRQLRAAAPRTTARASPRR